MDIKGWGLHLGVWRLSIFDHRLVAELKILVRTKIFGLYATDSLPRAKYQLITYEEVRILTVSSVYGPGGAIGPIVGLYIGNFQETCFFE